MGVRGRGNDLIEYFAKRSDVEIAYLGDRRRDVLPSGPPRSRRSAAQRPKTVAGPPPRARGQGRRRRRRRHARPLARPGDHLGLPGRQGRLRREADRHNICRRPQDGRGGPQVQPRRAGRHAEPQRHRTSPRPSSTSARASSARSTFVKVFNLQPRRGIGQPARRARPRRRRLRPVARPGPACGLSTANRFHYEWHWYWAYSGGDLGNDGIHQLDLARWCIGRTPPQERLLHGGHSTSSRTTRRRPDTQIVTWDYDGLTMAFEQTLWTPYQQKTPMNLRDRDVLPKWPFSGTRVEIYGSKQWMMLGPSRRRLGGLRRRLQVGGPPLRQAIQRRARRQLPRLHPHPE